MTKREVEKLLRDLQVRMFLRHWDIAIDWNTAPNEGCDATLWVANTYDDAVLYLAAGWRSWSPWKMRQTLLHELGHATTRDLVSAVESIKDELEGSVWNVYQDRFFHELEGVVDRYATIVARETA